ncbi:divergent polysaccharide deacetylase family protein [Jannaschia sp. 2305UL9-9]|uniref:divergent polysaccharide deacetylase family protein n=1 Tax=Jannaschia sp. 2305UL9-9 TaxID=3121638 RepID=UPI0035281A8F
MGYETSKGTRMWRGLLVGAGSGAVLSGLLVGAVSLLAPTPGQIDSTRIPVAPQMGAAEDSAPKRPEGLPRESGLQVTVGEVVPTATVDVVADATSEASADETPDEALALPAGSQFNLPPVDQEPMTPGADAVLRTDVTIVRPDPDVPTDAPAPDTATASQPQPGRAIASVTAPAAGDAPARPATVSEGAPQTFREVETTVVEQEIILAAPVETVAAPPSQDPDVPETGPTSQPPTDQEAESPAEESEETNAEADGPVVLVTDPVVIERTEVEEEEAPFIIPRRIVLDSERAAEDATGAEAGETPEPAIIANAEPFSNPLDLPLFSIILIDDPSTGMTRDNLLAFDFPVTFAVDPTAPDAAETMQFYRDAGHEVLMLATGLPVSDAPQDIEIALTGALAEMPGAVGILDREDGGFSGNREALSALLPPMAEVGLGLVTYGGGLNSGVANAQRDGIPADSLYRVIDADGERAPVITRYLDRATFEAAQDGRAMVVGRTSPDTVTALFSWALGRRSEAVAVAPVSHLLRAAIDG